MIRLSNLFLFIIVFTGILKSQNIFDETHTAKFADYLFDAQKYSLAIDEYYKLIFLNPDTFYYKEKLLQSYRLVGNPQKEYELFNKFFLNTGVNTLPPEILKEKIKMYVALNLSDDLINDGKKGLFGNSTLNSIAILSGYLLANHPDSASRFYSSLPNSVANNYTVKAFVPIIEEARHIKLKKPWLAAILSTILPGTGKVYSGFVWDGVVSLIFTSGSGFVAYRGFALKGLSSIIGWVFAGFTAFYYLGNIYGSVKAAKRYNELKKHKIYHRVENIVVNNKL